MTPTPHRHGRMTLGVSFALAVATLTGCTALGATSSAQPTSSSSSTSAGSGSTTTKTVATDTSGLDAIRAANEDQTTVNDDEWNVADAVDITLSGSTATTESSNVSVSDGVVSITAAGMYRLTGDFTGTVSVDAPEDALVVLILNGVAISADGAPGIQVNTADDAAIFLADGTSNSVTSTGSYAEDADANAAIWADTDLTLSGTGSLTVDGSANDGITAEDDLVILSGVYSVTAADDGLRGKDSLTAEGGEFTIDAGGDGLTSDQDNDATRGYIDIQAGTFDITAGSDGIDAFTDLLVSGGDITISSEEGLEGGTVAIGGGTVTITSTDDGINGSAGSTDDAAQGGFGGGGMQDSGELVLITGGEVTIDAQGDGLDSNGSMEITGGTIVVYGPTSGGNGALDTNGTFTISGGTLIALGSAGMAESPSTDSAQAWVAVSAQGSAGQTVSITNASGTELASVVAAKNFETVVFSSPDVAAGETYTVSADGSSIGSAATGQALSGGGFGRR